MFNTKIDASIATYSHNVNNLLVQSNTISSVYTFGEYRTLSLTNRIVAPLSWEWARNRLYALPFDNESYNKTHSSAHDLGNWAFNNHIAMNKCKWYAGEISVLIRIPAYIYTVSKTIPSRSIKLALLLPNPLILRGVGSAGKSTFAFWIFPP